MSRQYLRDINITIGNSSDNITLTDLRFRFKIEKTLLGVPNIAKIEIYNLSENTRSKIEDEYKAIVINAGYKNNVSLLFSGSITYVFHNKVDAEMITEIYAADGRFSYINSFFSKTYSNEVQYPTIYEDVISTFDDVTSGDISAIPEQNNSLLGQTFFAPSRDIMNDLSENLDLIWYIENQKINVIEKKGVLESNVVEFDSTNGMIGSPIVTEIGINLNVLLRPDLKTGSAIRVNSTTPRVVLSNYYFTNIKPTKGTGTYRIDKLLHLGDTHGDEWQTLIEGSIFLS